MKGMIAISIVPRISHLTLSSCLSTYLEKGSYIADLVIKNRVLASPAAKIVPPAMLSFMKIARMGCINPKPLRTKISEIINNLTVLFIGGLFS